jgi:hypothetical protein
MSKNDASIRKILRIQEGAYDGFSVSAFGSGAIVEADTAVEPSFFDRSGLPATRAELLEKRPLEAELEFFIAHQDELVKKHEGKLLVIKGEKVIGVYEQGEELHALRETSKDHEPGTFMLQRCLPGPEAYTITFYGPSF